MYSDANVPLLPTFLLPVIFGRLIAYVGEEFSPVRAKRVTLIFVIFDVLVRALARLLILIGKKWLTRGLLAVIPCSRLWWIRTSAFL